MCGSCLPWFWSAELLRALERDPIAARGRLNANSTQASGTGRRIARPGGFRRRLSFDMPEEPAASFAAPRRGRRGLTDGYSGRGWKLICSRADRRHRGACRGVVLIAASCCSAAATLQGHRQVRERLPAGQGQPGRGRRASPAGTIKDDRARRRRHRARRDGDRATTTRRCPRARWRRSAPSRSRGSPTATSQLQMPEGDQAGTAIPDGGTLPLSQHRLRGRPRPALQHPRRRDRRQLQEGDQGLRPLLRRGRPADQPRLSLPEPVPLHLAAASSPS